MRPVQRNISAYFWVVLFGAAIFACLGLRQVIIQTWQLTHFRPVPATIISSSYIYIHGHKAFGSYFPLMRFTYMVDGTTFIGKNTYPGTLQYVSYRNAVDIVSRFPAGKQVLAFYAPSRPSESFLIDVPLFNDYLRLICAPFVIGLILFYHFHFDQRERRRHRWNRRQLLIAALCIVLTASVFTHYFVIGGSWSEDAIIVFVMSCCLNVAMLYVSANLHRHRPISQADSGSIQDKTEHYGAQIE
jgi:hypothetical protein